MKPTRWMSLSGQGLSGKPNKPESVHPGAFAPAPAVDVEAWVSILASLEARRDAWGSPGTGSCEARARRRIASAPDEAGVRAMAADVLLDLDRTVLERIAVLERVASRRQSRGSAAHVTAHVEVLDALFNLVEARGEEREALRAREQELAELEATSASTEAAAQAEVSRLRAECVEQRLRADREHALVVDAQHRTRVARDTADVMAAACAARTADADALRAALDDAEARVRDEARRAAVAEQSLLDEPQLRREVTHFEERLRTEEAKVNDLVASRLVAERQLEAERARRVEAEHAYRRVLCDVAAERDRATREKARADAAKPELDQLRKDVHLLRGRLTALGTALSEQHVALPPAKLAAVVFEEMDNMRRKYEAKVKDARRQADTLHAKTDQATQPGIPRTRREPAPTGDNDVVH